jgi:hypothetical protein
MWKVRAFILEDMVDAMLLERLQATTIDEAAWAAALASVENVDQSEVRRLKAAIRQAETAKDNIIASLGLLSNPEMVTRAQARYEAANHEISGLQAELARIQSGAQKSVSLADARPALELVIAHWGDVPNGEKRALFEAFAQYINVSKVSRKSKRISIHWRDGSVSTRTTTHKSLGYFWEDDELETLRALVEGHAPQWRILRSFPDYTWRSIQERYAYNFGEGGRWGRAYQGDCPYNRHTRWQDTEEYRAEQAEAQVASISVLSDRP